MTPEAGAVAVLVTIGLWTARGGRGPWVSERACALLGPVDGVGAEGPPHRPEREPGRGKPDASDVADALVLLALAYRSGLPTTDVLDVVAERGPATTRRDLRQVAAALRWGASDVEAWESVGSQWAGAARAVVLAGAAGTAPGSLLLAAAEDLRRNEAQDLEARTARLPVRLVVPTGLVLLPAFCLVTVVPLVAALARRVLGGA